MQSVRDSNPWPSPWQGDILTNWTNRLSCTRYGIRTRDFFREREASYTTRPTEHLKNTNIGINWIPSKFMDEKKARQVGLEPTTFGFGGRHSTNWVTDAYASSRIVKLNILKYFVKKKEKFFVVYFLLISWSLFGKTILQLI